MGNKNSYDNMLSHLWWHDPRGWLLKGDLLRGARKEDARTIKEAVKRVSSTRLREALAKVLTDE